MSESAPQTSALAISDPLITEAKPIPSDAIPTGNGGWLRPRHKGQKMKMSPGAYASRLIGTERDRLLAKWTKGTLNLTQIKAFAKDPTNGARRIAAISLMKMAEIPDLADYEEALNGEKSLKQLRDEGIDTSVIRRFKVKTKRFTNPAGNEEVQQETDIVLKEDYFQAWDRTVAPPERKVALTTTQGEQEKTVDLANLTPEELETMLKLADKAANGPPHVQPEITVSTPTPATPMPTQIIAPEEVRVDPAPLDPVGGTLVTEDFEHFNLPLSPAPGPVAENACEENGDGILSRLRQKYGLESGV